ncbi:MAG: cysteine synthase family protein [Candidatus Wallbacteria bacterium]|nr:cysteine synthase family protein [Candidatus Wallbacteria bacterium]
MLVAESILDLIGKTPMKRLIRLSPPGGAEVWAKLEYMNPGGSLKDRTALGMIRDAEVQGRIQPGKSTLIEPTAGNTGVGLALVGVNLGYRVIAVMPSTYSMEKQVLIEALGAEVVRTPDADGIKGAIQKAEELAAVIEGGVILQQFKNPSNPDIHYRTTGPEIWEQTEGNIAAVVVGAGTGGTFTGIARFIKEKAPQAKAFVVESQGSIYGGGQPGKHIIEGIGGSFFPATLDLELSDGVLTVTDRQALAMLKKLAREEGLLVGGSAGAVAHAAIDVAQRFKPGQRVVAVFPDPAERYMSKNLLKREV